MLCATVSSLLLRTLAAPRCGANAHLCRAEKMTPRAPARARLPLLRFRPGGIGLDGATRGAENQCNPLARSDAVTGTLRDRVGYLRSCCRRAHIWRIRLVAYGARLESVLGESPRGFESPILRQWKRLAPSGRAFLLFGNKHSDSRRRAGEPSPTGSPILRAACAARCAGFPFYGIPVTRHSPKPHPLQPPHLDTPPHPIPKTHPTSDLTNPSHPAPHSPAHIRLGFPRS